jgi:hypothetical protein
MRSQQQIFFCSLVLAAFIAVSTCFKLFDNSKSMSSLCNRKQLPLLALAPATNWASSSSSSSSSSASSSSSSSSISSSSSRLYAKKAAKSLISSDLLSSLDVDDDDSESEAADANKVEPVGQMGSKKDKKLSKMGLSSDFLSSLQEEESGDKEGSEDTGKKKKKEKKDKKDKLASMFSVESLEEKVSEKKADKGEVHLSAKKMGKNKDKKGGEMAGVGGSKERARDEAEDEEEEEESQEEKEEREDAERAAANLEKKRNKPSSRVRFVESSQPGFVSMGLDKVSLMFGDNEVRADV